MSSFLHRYNGYNPLYNPFYTSHNETLSKIKTYIRNYAIAICIVCLASAIANIVLAVKVSHRYPEFPMDNYQNLNQRPLVNAEALGAAVPPNTLENAIVTSLYTDGYATAVATLGHSISKVNSTASRLVLYIPEQISPRALCIATASGFTPYPVSRIPPPHGGRHVDEHFMDQYSKLNVWTLDEAGYKSVVYLDADTLVHRNFDELFALPYSFAATPDVSTFGLGWTIMFNAGVMFLRPSSQVFVEMLRDIETASFRETDAEQAFLNQYYGVEAVRLPYAYNANLAIKERSPAMWEGLRREARITHYTVIKPFLVNIRAWHDVVDMRHVEKHVLEQIGKAKGGLFDEELRSWLEMWRSTRREHDERLTECSRLPSAPRKEG